MLGRKNTLVFATLALAIGLLFSGAFVQAESMCKGLGLGQCQKKGGSG